MKLFQFDAATGQPLTQFGSHDVMLSRVVFTPGAAQIRCFTFSAGGVVGYHPAVVPQLFVVVQGKGWVRGESEERIPISAGQAAFWTPGENHESGSDTSMVAFVIEGEGLGPEQYMSAL